MDLKIEYPLFAIKIINSLMHMLGFHALVTVYKRNNRTNMMLYLCNLSLIEAVRNFIAILLFVPNSPSASAVNVISKLHMYIRMLGDVIKILHFSAMMLLTINRLLVTRLDWEYNIFCTLKKAKIVLLGNWIVAVIIFISFLAWHISRGLKDGPEFSNAYLFLDVVYVIMVSITYASWFYQYKTSPIMRAELLEARIDSTIFEVFRRSCFFVLDLLIASFVVISVIPDIILNTLTLTHHDIYVYPIGGTICVPISDMVHAFFMYFIETDTRKIFMNSFTSRCCIRICNLRREAREEDVTTFPDDTTIGRSQDEAIEMYKI